MIVLLFGAVIGVWVLFQPRFWGLYFPFWFALFPKGFVLLDVPGVPVVTMYRFIGIMIMISMSARYFAIGWHWIRGTPLLSGFLLVILSASFSAISNASTSNAGFLGVFNLFSEIFVPAAAFAFFFSKLDFENQTRYFQLLLVFWGVIALYATVAYQIDFNPYIEFLKSTTLTGRIEVETYAGSLRGLRAQGTMSHPITFGASLVTIMIGTLALSLLSRGADKRGYRQFPRLFWYLMILVALVLVKSRSPLLMLAVAFMMLILFSSLARAYWISFGLVVVGALGVLFVPPVRDVALALLNIFNPEVGPDQHGSTIEMRRAQLAIGWEFLLSAPLFGNGLNATRNIVLSGLAPELYDSESILFTLMINQGLFGLLAYIALFLQATVKQFQCIKDRNVRAMAIGLIFGYAVFILSTGTLETMQLFIAVYAAIVLSARTLETEKIT